MDMVICYATAPGNLAVRSPSGSPFIKYFADLLRKGSSIDDIMRRVTWKMCQRGFRIENGDDDINVKIAPQIESSLRKKLVF